MNSIYDFCNEETQSLNYLKRRLLEEDVDERAEEEDYNSLNPKKPKLTWTTALHNKFLEAIDFIGLESKPSDLIKLLMLNVLLIINGCANYERLSVYAFN